MYEEYMELKSKKKRWKKEGIEIIELYEYKRYAYTEVLIVYKAGYRKYNCHPSIDPSIHPFIHIHVYTYSALSRCSTTEAFSCLSLSTTR